MKNSLATLWVGTKEPFKNKRYIALFIASTLVMSVLFTLIPVFSVPGNSLATQLSIFTPRDYAVIAFLSLLYALFIAMQVFVIRQKKEMRSVGTAVGGSAGALFAGIAGTAFCASCLIPLFALFGIGFGGVLFVLQYRFYFVIGITVLMLIAIYFTARRIRQVCNC